jgi:lysophospholipase L1-like esterase
LSPQQPAARALRWAGLGLAAAAALLDAGVLLRWFGPLGLRESPWLAWAAALARIAVFGAGLAVLARRPGARSPLAPFLRGALCYLGFVAATAAFGRAEGVGEILVAGAAVALAALTLRQAAVALLAGLGSPLRLPLLRRPLLLLAALTLSCAAAELALAALARRPAALAAPARIVMPEALQRRDAEVAGAKLAYWWQGKLHVHDAEGFRRATPFPPRRPGVYRILALGDSLTYGYGVDAADAWPAVLERGLARVGPVEVLNLGVSGAQSEDILERLGRLLPVLGADLAVYGVCLNDFLPSQRVDYRNNRAWGVAFPGSFHLEHGTRLGGFVAARYDRLLMRLGLRTDFFGDILRDVNHTRERFARDVAAMNRLVTAAGLPPLVAMVLDQYPESGGRGRRIGRIAEEALVAAGALLVPSEGYIRANDGRRDLMVSPWEGHPNEEAHRIFAAELQRAIEPILRRAQAPPAGGAGSGR